MAEYSSDKTKVVPRRSRSGDQTVPVTIRAILRVLTGTDAGRTFSLTAAETTIGRGETADIQIDDESISRVHAVISFSNMEFRIRDLDSANGTILNGSEVSEYALRNQDRVMVGETMLQFNIERI